MEHSQPANVPASMAASTMVQRNLSIVVLLLSRSPGAPDVKTVGAYVVRQGKLYLGLL